MNALEWLLDADPAIRWQALRDLTDAPADEVAAERARVATEGWGARLLALRREDGLWDVGKPDTTEFDRNRKRCSGGDRRLGQIEPIQPQEPQ